MNKEILSPRSNTTSNTLSCMDNIEIFDNIVHGSTTQERNLGLSCIEEVFLKSIYPELRKEFDSSLRVNLKNSVLSKSTNFISIGHPTAETADIWNIDLSTSTRANNLNGLRIGTERNDRMGYMHDFKTMSKKIAYRNHIKNS